jgi:hypothetical protein
MGQAGVTGFTEYNGLQAFGNGPQNLPCSSGAGRLYCLQQ